MIPASMRILLSLFQNVAPLSASSYKLRWFRWFEFVSGAESPMTPFV